MGKKVMQWGSYEAVEKEVLRRKPNFIAFQIIGIDFKFKNIEYIQNRILS